MGPRSRARGLAVLLALLLGVLNGSQALFFEVQKEGHRCFLADVPAGTTFRAEYESPDTTDAMKTVLAIYAPDPAKGEDETSLVKKESTTSKGAIPFTAEQNGDHWVCVSLDSSNYALPDGTSMRFVLKLSMSASSEEYQHLAKKSDMSDLHLDILKLRDRVKAIQRSQDYAKEKSMALQTSIEANNQRATWVSVGQIGLLLVTGFYQAKHLQKYFHRKKLV